VIDFFNNYSDFNALIYCVQINQLFLKNFLSYTALIEAMTGFGLLLFPEKVISILFNSVLSGSVAGLMSLIAGAGIFCLSLLCWMARKTTVAYLAVYTLLVYNFILSFILLYEAFIHQFSGLIFELVIAFHIFQTLYCIALVIKKNREEIP
jgi:hypothetical protein